MGAGLLAGPGRNLYYRAITESRRGGALDAEAAYRMAAAGDVILVDIRRPDEWAATGRPAGSVGLDMRGDSFADDLERLAGGRDAPVALICARGVRSARLANRLAEQGFGNVVDVPEGMLGSPAGPGWLARGLPLDGS